MNEERKRLMYEIVSRHSRGESIRKIAQGTGKSRATVRRILLEAEKQREDGSDALKRSMEKAPTPRGSILDPYIELMTKQLEQYPDLTSLRMYEMLRERGFGGSYSLVRGGVRKLRESRKDKGKKAYGVVETGIGQQCQFDWSPQELADKTVVHFWCCILSWSRYYDMVIRENTRQSTTFRALQRSFEFFGGVPAEAVLDSMPGLVDRWENDEPVLNVKFVDFAVYYGFKALVSPRYYPEFKGKVERRFRHISNNFMDGRTFYSKAQMEEELAVWLERQRLEGKHPLTKRPPAEMFALERGHLQPLPPRAYDTRDVVIRVVDTQGYVQHETNRYRVPDKAIGKRVYLVLGDSSVLIADTTAQHLAEHERMPVGANQRVTLAGVKDRRQYDVELLGDRLRSWGPSAESFVAALHQTNRYWGRHMARILAMQNEWWVDDIVKALEHAQLYHAIDSASVERILRAKFVPMNVQEQLARRTRQQVRGTMREHPVQQRLVSDYESLRSPAIQPIQTEEGTDEPKS